MTTNDSSFPGNKETPRRSPCLSCKRSVCFWNSSAAKLSAAIIAGLFAFLTAYFVIEAVKRINFEWQSPLIWHEPLEEEMWVGSGEIQSTSSALALHRPVRSFHRRSWRDSGQIRTC